MSRLTCAIRTGVCCVLALAPREAVGRTAPATGAVAQGDAERMLACSPERLVLTRGEELTVRAWARPEAVEYRWSTDEGELLRPNQSEAVWRTTSLYGTRVRTLTVTATDASGVSQTCSVSVLVQQVELTGQRGPYRLMRRSVLFADTQEVAGSGLYSYILIGSEPSDGATRRRYLRVLRTYFDAGTLTELDRYRQALDADPERVNALYLPLRIANPLNDHPDLTFTEALRAATGAESPLAELLLDSYDYNKARELLGRLPGTLHEGPYIVSYHEPLSRDGPDLSERYLLQDLSAVEPPELIGVWFKEFLYQAAQPAFWEERLTETFALRLRTSIEHLARSVEGLEGALERWIRIVRRNTPD